MPQDFVCTHCHHTWSPTPDADGLYDGFGNPQCPVCGRNGADANDYGDYTCRSCGNNWRAWGNGGYQLGMVPNCPTCGSSQITEH